jgi:hypothetical protein
MLRKFHVPITLNFLVSSCAGAGVAAGVWAEAMPVLPTARKLVRC